MTTVHDLIYKYKLAFLILSKMNNLVHCLKLCLMGGFPVINVLGDIPERSYSAAAVQILDSTHIT
jgi:hypothetical protein